MAKISEIDIDLDAQHEGVWVHFRFDIRFKLARFGNAKFKEWQEDKAKFAFEKVERGEELSEDETKLVAYGIARYIVLDWQNIQDDDGNDVPYSPEKCLEFLLDDRKVELLLWIREEATNAENFRAKRVEAERGKSGTGSDGS